MMLIISFFYALCKRRGRFYTHKKQFNQTHLCQGVGHLEQMVIKLDVPEKARLFEGIQVATSVRLRELIPLDKHMNI